MCRKYNRLYTCTVHSVQYTVGALTVWICGYFGLDSGFKCHCSSNEGRMSQWVK